MEKKFKAFISGALSGVHGKVMLETFYERIAALCEKENITAFVPHLQASSTPEHPYSPDEIYKINMDAIEAADLLIAYVGQPAIGVGMEIQKACAHNKDIIIISEKDVPLSILLSGCREIIIKILFDDFDNALSQLQTALKKWLDGKKVGKV